MSWSADDKRDEVLRAPIGGHLPVADVRVVARPGWYQTLRPGGREQSSNEVVLSVLAPEDAERVIDEAVAQYGALGVRFKWVVGPGTAPADLGERLERRGFERSEVRGMCCDPSLSVGAGEVRVEPLTEDAVPVFARVMVEGWGADLDGAETDALATLRSPRHRSFLAWVGDQPAGAAGTVRHPRSAYLVGAVVLPLFRGAGVYRALLRARLADAWAHGATLATTHAREATSAPILAHLGFETVYRYPIYRSP